MNNEIDLGYKQYSSYGNKIIATLSQKLTERYEKGNMMLNEDRVKVVQYLTCLPDKQWFIEKLNRSILIAKEYTEAAKKSKEDGI